MVVVMVTVAIGIAIRLLFVVVVMMDAMAIAVLVQVTFLVVDVVEEVIKVCAPIAHRLLWVQQGLLTLWCSAVLPHFIDKEYFGHVVDDEDLSPVRDWLGLSTTEMNVHDEDSKRG